MIDVVCVCREMEFMSYERWPAVSVSAEVTYTCGILNAEGRSRRLRQINGEFINIFNSNRRSKTLHRLDLVVAMVLHDNCYLLFEYPISRNGGIASAVAMATRCYIGFCC